MKKGTISSLPCVFVQIGAVFKQFGIGILKLTLPLCLMAGLIVSALVPILDGNSEHVEHV